MFHKASGTLLVTDAVIFIPDSPPEASQQDTVGCCCQEAACTPEAGPASIIPGTLFLRLVFPSCWMLSACTSTRLVFCRS